MHDLVIRNGKIVDGTGAASRECDIAIVGDRIVEVGAHLSAGRKEIDAQGRLVTPGWVDIHTHYDGQVTWDPHLSPSGGMNGVTSVVMGNCGVGFAPVRPDRYEWLVELMEGVEDIPGTALSEGIQWKWESFPEYLDALDAMPRSLDVGTQIPHGAVRAYVMEERGAQNEKATPEDIASMGDIVTESLRAGALGFSTSRTMLHRSKNGELVPGTFADNAELLGIARAMGEAGAGVFECASDLADEEKELGWMHEFSKLSGRPVSFACLQNDMDKTQYRRLLEASDRSAAEGGNLRPQVAARPAGMLMGLESSLHPFIACEAYRGLAHLSLEERVAQMRKPEVRKAILESPPVSNAPMVTFISLAFHKLFPLGDPPDYEPGPEKSVRAIADRENRDPKEVAYDLLLEKNGKELLYFPVLGYSNGNFDDLREMMLHPRSVFGLSDGGAHCGLICDASIPTYLLTHWGRDRSRGEKIPIEMLVASQTRETAALYGLHDRGVIAPGMKADLNVIDFDALRIRIPAMAYDLPTGARRLMQQVEGYDYTVCSGQVTFERGEATGAMPGRLIRGAQSA